MNMKFAIALLATLGLTACSGHSQNQNAQDQGNTVNEQNLQAGLLTVTDSNGKPVAGAKVLIGTAVDMPFTGNMLTTNAAGQITTPVGWINSQPITLDASGYVRTTYMAQAAGAMTLQMRAQPGTAQLLVTGQTTQFGNLQNDGTMDIGLVFPGFARKDLINFQLSDVVSPVNDQISISGKDVAIPSNVTLPNQTETYIIFPISFNKPQYRFFVNKPGTYSVVAEHAQLPFGKVVGNMTGGGSLMDSINDIHFVSASVQDVPVGALGVSIDLAVNQVSFNSSIQVTAPAIDSSQMMLSVALAAKNSLLYPADIKRVDSNQSQTLTYPTSSTSGQGMILSALLASDAISHKGASAEQMSLTFSPNNQSSAIDFLSVISAPHVSTTALTVQVPSRIAGAQPLLTYATQSQVNGTLLTPHWDIFVPGWSGAIDLPTWPSDVAPAGALRWSVMFAAGATGSTPSAKLGPAMLQTATHLTRSAVDL